MRPRQWLIAAAVVISLCVSCTNEPEHRDADRATSANRAQVSPLAEHLGLSGNVDYIEYAFASTHALEQEAISQCMAELGFEYQPLPATVGVDFGPVFGKGLTDEEFVEQFGLGLSPILEWVDDSVPPDPLGDLNREVLTALPASEQVAWVSAFEGDGVAGCAAEARAEVGAISDPLLSFDKLTELTAQLGERIAVDERVLAAERGWASCMASDGYNFATRDDMYQSILVDLMPLHGEVFSNAPSGGEAVAGGDSRDELPAMSAQQQARFDQLFAREREIAQVDLRCSQEVDAIEQVVRFELEAELVAQFG